MCVTYTERRGDWRDIHNDVVRIARTSHRRTTRGQPYARGRAELARKSLVVDETGARRRASRTGALAARGRDSATLESVRRKSRAVPRTAHIIFFVLSARIFFSAPAEARGALRKPVFCTPARGLPLSPAPSFPRSSCARFSGVINNIGVFRRGALASERRATPSRERYFPRPRLAI